MRSGESLEFVGPATVTLLLPLPLPAPQPCSVIGGFSAVADGWMEAALLQLVGGSAHHSPVQVSPPPASPSSTSAPAPLPPFLKVSNRDEFASDFQSDRRPPVGCSHFGLITVCPRLKHSLTAPQCLENIFICRLRGIQSRLLRLVLFISPCADLRPSTNRWSRHSQNVEHTKCLRQFTSCVCLS